MPGVKVVIQRASIAQMVERKTLNLVVVGSIPIEGAFLFESVFIQYTYMVFWM